MSYLSFLLWFLFLPILGLSIVHTAMIQTVRARESWKWIALLAAIAFVYTTPWDNYLVYRGVWGYGSERVLGTIGYVPVEEYMFFILQPIMTGLWTSLVVNRIAGVPLAAPPAWFRPLYIGVWLVLAALGLGLLFGTRSLYLGLILAWAAPVLAGMAWLSADTFWRYRRAWLLGVTVPTVYLWIADRFAIGDGIWEIADTYSFGFDPWGLPVEEAVFFLVTNLLVVQGLLMLLPMGDDNV